MSRLPEIKIPFIVDSPMTNLDKEQQSDMMNSWTNFDKQLIILVQPKMVDKTSLKRMCAEYEKNIEFFKIEYGHDGSQIISNNR